MNTRVLSERTNLSLFIINGLDTRGFETRKFGGATHSLSVSRVYASICNNDILVAWFFSYASRRPLSVSCESGFKITENNICIIIIIKYKYIYIFIHILLVNTWFLCLRGYYVIVRGYKIKIQLDSRVLSFKHYWLQ